VNASSRRLASLIAALTPERAAALVRSLAPSLAHVGDEAMRLVTRPRAERLQAVAAALEPRADGGIDRALVHPVIARLAAEAAGVRPDACGGTPVRPVVRAADASAPAARTKPPVSPPRRFWHAPWKSKRS
jgi:hypothetical protein